MTRPTARLVYALRTTALRLREGTGYKWSHFGMCNCGNLAQTITGMDASSIHELAFKQSGDWGEQGRDYCPTSGLPMDLVVAEMLKTGLEPTDLGHIERLSHPEVMPHVPPSRRLHHASREDTIYFMELWADLLEARMSEAQQSELAELLTPTESAAESAALAGMEDDAALAA